MIHFIGFNVTISMHCNWFLCYAHTCCACYQWRHLISLCFY